MLVSNKSCVLEAPLSAANRRGRMRARVAVPSCFTVEPKAMRFQGAGQHHGTGCKKREAPVKT
eukprot:scaffold98910_cov21-Tisochrysis_lutea.AAC.1